MSSFKVALISDLMPQQDRGGDLALFRLFSGFDPRHLVVVHPRWKRQVASILPSVKYSQIPSRLWLSRFKRTRLNSVYNLINSIFPPPISDVSKSLANFSPTAVVSVAHGFLWISAAKWCEINNIPFYLIIHDDWPNFIEAPKPLRILLGNIFRRILRQSSLRFCVSPTMASEYRKIYNCSCDVLFPFRGLETPAAVLRVKDANKSVKKTIVGYLGSLPLRGYVASLLKTADLLAEINAELRIYGSHTLGDLSRHGLDHPAISLFHSTSYAESFDRLVDEATALFCPASFYPGEAYIMQTLFPSKLADYTACGLPIIIWGPESSSAVKWAHARPNSAFVCTDLDGKPIQEFVLDLIDSPSRARLYAQGALDAGSCDFDPERGQDRFFRAIQNDCAFRNQ